MRRSGLTAGKKRGVGGSGGGLLVFGRLDELAVGGVALRDGQGDANGLESKAAEVLHLYQGLVLVDLQGKSHETVAPALAVVHHN